MRNRIQLKGIGRQDEAKAASAITPGHLIAVLAAGTVAVHGTEGGVAERAFALEDALQGRDIDTAYSAGDPVSYLLASPGDVVYAFLKAGENVTPATVLISAGDGTLIAEGSAASGTTVVQRIGKPTEVLDLSASGAVNTRVPVRVL